MNDLFGKVYDCQLVDGKIVTRGSLAGVGRMPFLRYETTVTVDADGSIDFAVHADTREDCGWFPRFGYEFALTDSNAGFTYFGKGPGENYCDLQRYATYGMWRSSAAEEYHPYIMPQEHGNHIGVNYLAFDNGLTFEAENAFECNVSLYSVKALTKARHTDELTPDGMTHVRIDYKNSGIGSNSCGPALLEKYRLYGHDMDFRFRMKL